MAFCKMTPVMKHAMIRTGGVREFLIVENAQCAVNVGKTGRYVKVIGKPNKHGKRETGIFDMKTASWCK